MGMKSSISLKHLNGGVEDNDDDLLTDDEQVPNNESRVIRITIGRLRTLLASKLAH